MKKLWERNDPHLAQLHPAFRRRKLAHHGLLAHRGVLVVITASYRPRPEQARLYQAFQDGDGPRAAAPGRSWHEYRVATDEIPFWDRDHDLVLDPEELTWDVEEDVWRLYAQFADQVGLRHGRGFTDWPHTEFHPGLTIEQAEALGPYSLDRPGIWRRIIG